MRAVHISTLDGPEAIELVDLPDPSAEGLVTIAVKAAGVAFPELLQTRGLYQMKPDLPFVPGAEVSGIVESAPEGSGLSAGDRVAALPLEAAIPAWLSSSRMASPSINSKARFAVPGTRGWLPPITMTDGTLASSRCSSLSRSWPICAIPGR